MSATDTPTPRPALPPLPTLSLVETRVLGVLVEKQLTTPDTYPLTVNSLIAGCNQKTSRDPVINASESDVQTALDTLKSLTLVVESYGASGRVLRYAHNVDRVLRLPGPIIAILAVLMLRGPQTPGELRSNCDRLYRFPDISALEAYLAEMSEARAPNRVEGRTESRAERPVGALIMQLPRQPGSREHRYAQLLGGMPEMPVFIGSQADDARHRTAPADDFFALKEEVGELRAEVATLRRAMQRLCAELGVNLEAPAPDA